MKIQANSTENGVSNHPRENSGSQCDSRLLHVRLEEPRRAIRLEPVSDPEKRLNVLVGISAQFLAQAADMDVQRTGPDLGSVSPDAHEQRVARNDLPGVLDQK